MSRNGTKDEKELLSVSRRVFLAGMGSVVAASAAISPLDALDRRSSSGFTKSGDVSRWIQFAAAFAPSEGLVKAVERPHRHDICLNGVWQFQPISLPEGFRDGRDPVAALAPAQNGHWDEEPLYVPSPWNVNSFADRHGEGGDFHCYPSYPEGWEKIEMGWLRKTVEIPADWAGRRVLLHFDAVAGNAEIVVNGKPVGSHFDLFLPFDLDVTSAIVFGGSNEVLVGVRKASLFDKIGSYGRRTYQGGSFWGQHIAGIWQDV